MSYKTNLTLNKRQQLKAQMDDFATFQWRGHDMFDDFGCFIINDKNGSLKFYNGPGFSNQYAKPQFSKSVNGLLGVDWKQQTIPMKVGLYWFTIEEYQEFLNCISPYEINYLTFNYAPDYGYLVKLGKIADSTRHIVGRNEKGEIVYYTELDLTWELMGDSCVRSNHSYEYNCDTSSNDNFDTYTWSISNVGDMLDDSLLDTGLMFELPLEFNNKTAELALKAEYWEDDAESSLYSANLFNISLDNLIHSAPGGPSDEPDNPGGGVTPGVKYYTVEWVVDTQVIHTETVTRGGTATPPQDPEVDGFKFIGWYPSNYSNILGNTRFVAQFELLDDNQLLGLWRIREDISNITNGNYSIMTTIGAKTYTEIRVQDEVITAWDAEANTSVLLYPYISGSSSFTFTVTGGSFLQQTSSATQFLESIAMRTQDWIILPSTLINTRKPSNNITIHKNGLIYHNSGSVSNFDSIRFNGTNWDVFTEKGGVVGIIYNFEEKTFGGYLTFKFDDTNITESQYEWLQYFAVPSDNPNVSPDTKHTVKFINRLTGEIISEQQVLSGKSAILPTIDIDWTQKFEGWSSNAYTNVTRDLTIYAEIIQGTRYVFDDEFFSDYNSIELNFASNKNNFTRITMDRDQATNQVGYMTYQPEEGPDIVAYESSFKETYNVVYVFEKYCSSQELDKFKLIIKPTYTLNLYGFDGIFLESIVVAHASAVDLPTPPKEYGYNFMRWDKNTDNVQDNMDIYAIYEPLEAPEGQILISPSDKKTMAFLGGTPENSSLQYYYEYKVAAGLVGIYDIVMGDVIEDLSKLKLEDAEACNCTYDGVQYNYKVRVAPQNPTVNEYQHEILLINTETDNVLLVTDDIFADKLCLVEFRYDDGRFISSQLVPYGGYITPPSAPETEWTEIFVNWYNEHGDGIGIKVFSDLTYHAEVSRGTVYTIREGWQPAENITYSNLWFRYYNSNNEVIDAEAMTLEYYEERDPDGYVISRSHYIHYNSETVYLVSDWMYDAAKTICVFKGDVGSFSEFLDTAWVENQPMTFKMMRSFRSIAVTADSNSVSTDNTDEDPEMRMTLRYDSETGLMYIQQGSNTTWHLLNYQTDNNRGEYLLSSSTVYKWKLPGTFSEPHLHTTKWKFVLTTKNTQINQVNLGTAFTIYARKNIV